MSNLTLLLIASNDLVWIGVRTALQSIDDVSVLGDVVDARHADAYVADAQPDIILMGPEAAQPAILPHVRSLRAQCPQSKIVVLAPRFQLADLLALAELNITGYALWRDLDLAALRHCLHAVKSCDLIFASRDVARHCLDFNGLRLQQQSDRPAPFLSERERAVLAGLSQGLSQKQIAAAGRISVRTVKRTIATLMDKLDAPSAFILGARARALGLIST